jgi:transcriptional regulator with XRE-family HTH domain
VATPIVIATRHSHGGKDLAGQAPRRQVDQGPQHHSLLRIKSDTMCRVVVSLLSEAREAAGLSKAALAERAGTSRPTLSAYEHGRVSPTLDTVERILAATGHRLAAEPIVHWREVEVGRGRTAAVPDRLPDLPVREAVRSFEMPLHLEWSRPGRMVDLVDRKQRARAYERVLREGRPVDIASIVDGVLLVDLWDELVLPRPIRAAWQPLVDHARGEHG